MPAVEILSHSQLETRSWGGRDDSAVILIGSPGQALPDIGDCFADVFVSVFADVEGGPDAIRPEQAAEIADFVFEQEAAGRDIIVSCHHGQSRSAAVAAAISAYSGDDEMRIWNDPGKAPNLLCYHLTCEALGVEFDENEIRERFLINSQAHMS